MAAALDDLLVVPPTPVAALPLRLLPSPARLDVALLVPLPPAFPVQLT